MHDVVFLVRTPSDSAVLRRLPYLSADAMQFILALLAFQRLTGRAGVVRMSEVIQAHGIVPNSAIINELFEAGVMGQRKDGIVIYHPIIQAMMAPLPASPGTHESGISNVVALSGNNRGAA